MVRSQEEPAASINPTVSEHGEGDAAIKEKSPEFVPPKAKLLMVMPDALLFVNVTTSVALAPMPTS